MFWKLTAVSASSPVESVLDKENFSLEELLDEEEIIQECKALNSRLINFLRDRAQVEQLLRYIVEEAPEDSESKRAFKFPFIACEIFTCEIDLILKTLVEEDQLMNLLFSFLEPDRPHSALLAGYFSKVVVCLMLRKTVPLMNYIQVHPDVFRHLVDLIGITSIMEVLIRLVGADDHVYPNFMDVMQWLADSNLLEMIVDKLNPSCPPEVHANAAETLCVITRNAPSALATRLASPSFVARIFGHALEDSHSKSGLVHSLSVCISLLDPKRSAISSPLMHSFRSQHMYESPIPVNPETIGAMLPNLHDLLMLLKVASDEKILPTTYGELRPPLGKHRLKIVEFIAVLLKTGNEAAEKELVNSGTIQRVLDLFFEYPYNNALHHHVESIIYSCLESKSDSMVDHLLRECNMIGKILQADKDPVLSREASKPTLPASGKGAPRAGNLGHITRVSNKLVQLASSNSHIQTHLQENNEWSGWQVNVLQERNAVENVYRWACGRPTALQDRTRDSDEDDLHDRDYDVASLANNLTQAFRYKIYGNNDAEEDNVALDRDDEDVYFDDDSAEVVISSLRLGDDQGRRPTALQDRTRDSDDDNLQDRDYDVASLANNLTEAFRYKIYGNKDAEEDHGALARDDEDVYFDDDSAEVVISSLRLGDNQASLFTNSNWFAFQDDRIGNTPVSTSPSEMMDEINLNRSANGGNGSSDDEVVVGEDDELTESKDSVDGTSTSCTNYMNPFSGSDSTNCGNLNPLNEKANASNDMGFFRFDTPENQDSCEDRPLRDWEGWRESSDGQVGGSSLNPFIDNDNSDVNVGNHAKVAASESASPASANSVVPNGSVTSMDSSNGSERSSAMPSLFEEDVEFVGVELEGTEKAMERALKEGIVGEAGPLKRNIIPKVPEKENSEEGGAGMKEFNDANYWRVDKEVAVLE